VDPPVCLRKSDNAVHVYGVLLKAIKPWRGILCCALAFALSADASVIVQLRVVEGEGATYRTGTRATRGVTVLVTDEAGLPLDMASVSFRLPDQGASGTFSSGLRTEVVTTGPDGRASVWGMQWNKTAGTIQIHITAVKEQARTGIVTTQYLSDALTAKAGGEGVFTASRSGGHKWLWIAAIAGVAAGGAAFALLRSKGTPSPTATPGLSVGAPSITIGQP
jgi:hypothetical protein